METDTLQSIDNFVSATRDMVSFREIDRLMIIRPGRIFHVTETAFGMLNSLYSLWLPAEIVTEKYSGMNKHGKDGIIAQLSELIENIRSLIKGIPFSAEKSFISDYNPLRAKYPVLADIALNYRCQNSCLFCGTTDILNGNDTEEMSAADVFTVLDRLYDEAKISMVTFSGGEPTLREDLPLILRYATGKKIKTCIRTNGISCSDRHYVKWLAEAGLDSAEVKLESHNPAIHDRITGNSGSHAQSINGIRNLIDSGIHTYTNTTVCRLNRESLIPLVSFTREEFKMEYLTMNMMLPQQQEPPGREKSGISYSEIGDIIKPLMRFCDSEGVKLIWQTPIPHCMLGPADNMPDAKSCTCISGIIPVTPSGDVVPCSGRGRSIGNLVRNPFGRVWNSDQAIYFRERRYTPPLCRNCTLEKICAGGCPVYWSNAGGFRELEPARKNMPENGDLIRRRNERLNLKLRGVKS